MAASSATKSAKHAARIANRHLARDVRKALTKDGDIDMSRVSVQARDGRITLIGSVPSEDQIKQAELHAKEVDHVIAVANRLSIDRPGH